MLDLLMNRRSIRKYTDQEVDQEIIDQIVTGALTSPTARNRKPLELVVVKDKKILEGLGALRGPISRHMKDAAFGMAVVANPELTDLWVEDACIMATIIQLMAESLGLGSCWIHVHGRFNDQDESVEEHVKDLLNIPDPYRVECMIAIGYPDEKKRPYTKDRLDFTKVHYDSF